MALRFFLGAFEAAYAPGIIYLLSFFYLRHEVGLRVGIFASAAPIASCYAGALAYGVLHGHSHLRSWRLLFLVEGLPTIAMAPIAWFFIPDSPDKARFLNSQEKAIVKSRAVRQTGHVHRVGGLKVKELFATLLDLKAWLLAVCHICPVIDDIDLQSGKADRGIADVLWHKRQLRKFAGVPAYYLDSDGLQRHQFARSLRTALLHRLSCRHRYYIHRR